MFSSVKYVVPSELPAGSKVPAPDPPHTCTHTHTLMHTHTHTHTHHMHTHTHTHTHTAHTLAVGACPPGPGYEHPKREH